MQSQYIVFWTDTGHSHAIRATVVHVAAPPHNPPRGSELEDLLCEGVLGTDKSLVILRGAVELPNPAWNVGRCLEVVLGTGIVASVECTGGSWRVHA